MCAHPKSERKKELKNIKERKVRLSENRERKREREGGGDVYIDFIKFKKARVRLIAVCMELIERFDLIFCQL